MSKLFGNFTKKVQVYKTKGEEFLYWKRYEAATKKQGVTLHKPFVGTKHKGMKPWNFSYALYDPITEQGKIRNVYKWPMPLMEPVKEWNFYMGDVVEVLVGHDKGKIGTIFKMFKERNVVYVQGLNKKVDPNTQILNFTEAPLFVTHEVKLVDPSDMKQTDIEWRFIENGERVRVSKRTGRLIPIPASARNTWEDGIDSTAYKNSKKDMDLDELKKVTFKPVNSTFEEAILKEHGLYEPQKKRKTYWY